ncbi:MAG: bifunctional metallophosphatase/5'-nucleotidase [Alicyclobacillus sp.]|nr:bifunctional metallophosphatase/5'-nucleotidase [Alicyclobacillus sp.]
MNIHILHTNDVHSQLENYMRLGTRLRQLRMSVQQRGEPVLTFDLGDVLDRVRPETEATQGRMNAALMAALEYDGWVFGNNEGLTIPPVHWQGLIERSRTLAFGTNLRAAGGWRLPGFVDWHVYDAGGVRVGVFGLTADYRLPYNRLGIQVDPPLTSARQAVDALRQQGAEVVVLLSHLGLAADRQLARQVAGIDIILGGHSHQFMPCEEWVGQTAIFQPGKHAQVFGYTVLSFDTQTRRLTDVHSQPVVVHPYDPLDPAMLSAYRGYLPDIEERLQQPVVQLNAPLPVRFDGESPFANLLADALLQAFPCDAALVMSGALTASLLAGTVRMQHVHGACTTPTRPLRMTLRGAELLSLLEKAVRPEYHGRAGYGYGFRGSVVGFLALANACVSLSWDRQGERVQVHRVLVGGQPLQRDRMYRVVTCEYLWLAPVFPEFQRGVDVQMEVPLVREVLLAALADPHLLAKAQQPRYCWLQGGTGG